MILQKQADINHWHLEVAGIKEISVRSERIQTTIPLMVH